MCLDIERSPERRVLIKPIDKDEFILRARPVIIPKRTKSKPKMKYKTIRRDMMSQKTELYITTTPKTSMNRIWLECYTIRGVMSAS